MGFKGQHEDGASDMSQAESPTSSKVCKSINESGGLHMLLCDAFGSKISNCNSCLS